ncbi:MAG: rhomboid family intrarane serine protease [Chitinophagaceae bacterium]|nr:rhomboid family intrarane serine protease [Chitinophagaceae bacterium]
MAVRDQFSRKKFLLGQDDNALVWLIIINAVVFLALALIHVVYQLSEMNDMQFNQQVTTWFTLPASFDVFITRPWTFFTHMFTHTGFWHVLSNMLWLWAFGFILQDLTGNKQLVPVYLYGALIGAFFFMLSHYTIPAYYQQVSNASPLVGAGCGVMAIAIATTTVAPEYRIFPMIRGGIPLWVLTAVYVVIDYTFVSGAGGPIAIAHLTAAATGFLYIKQLNRGRDMGEWMHRFGNWLDDLFNPSKKHTQKPQEAKRFYKGDTQPWKKIATPTQKKIDEILDKINQRGFESLSADEKEFLRKASENDQL